MIQSFTLLKNAFPHIEERADFPFLPSYVMDYRDREAQEGYEASQYFFERRFGLSLQRYDAPDAEVCLLEVDAQEPVTIPLRTERSDLHWIYCLRGNPQLLSSAPGEHPPLIFRPDTYANYYTPAGEDYLLKAGTGRSLLLSFTLKAHWLLRKKQVSPDPPPELLEYLRQRGFECLGSRLQSIHALVKAQLLYLIGLPLLPDLRMDVHVYGPVTALVVQGREDLKSNRKDKGNSLLLAIGIRQYCDEQIRDGRNPKVEDVAGAFGISAQYINRIQRQHFGCGLKHYLHEQRMEEALKRLRSGYSPKEVSDWLDYTYYSTFSHQFKEYHKFPPEGATTT